MYTSNKKNWFLCIWVNSLLVLFFHIISSFQKSHKDDSKNFCTPFSQIQPLFTFVRFALSLLSYTLYICLCACVCVDSLLKHLKLLYTMPPPLNTFQHIFPKNKNIHYPTTYNHQIVVLLFNTQIILKFCNCSDNML